MLSMKGECIISEAALHCILASLLLLILSVLLSSRMNNKEEKKSFFVPAGLFLLLFCLQEGCGTVLQRLLPCDEPCLLRVHPRLLQEGTARSTVPSDLVRGV